MQEHEDSEDDEKREDRTYATFSGLPLQPVSSKRKHDEAAVWIRARSPSYSAMNPPAWMFQRLRYTPSRAISS
jgi:hypothetical protein